MCIRDRARRYKAIVLVIVLLAILLTTAVLAHRRTAQEKMGAMTFRDVYKRQSTECHKAP